VLDRVERGGVLVGTGPHQRELLAGGVVEEYASNARRSASVNGGGTRLRGHRRSTRTTFTSAAYRTTRALRKIQASRPSTIANKPYVGLMFWSQCCTTNAPTAWSTSQPTAATAAPGSTSSHPSGCDVRTLNATANTPTFNARPPR
jgi:hypothetical protein